MCTKPFSKHFIVFILLITVSVMTACSKQTDQQTAEAIDQSQLLLIDQSAEYISWDDAKLVQAIQDWQASPSLYEPVGVMLSDRGEANGVSLEQTINKLHEDYEKLGVDSSYMAVMIEALSSDIKMFDQSSHELNLPINPDSEKVALNSVNIKSKAGHNYSDLTQMIEQYFAGKIDATEMDNFIEETDMILVINDGDYQKLYACDVGFLPSGQNDGKNIVKLIIDSGVDGAYFQILRKK